MSDRRSEVPVWAFLNAQIVQEAFRSGDLSKATEQILPVALSKLDANWLFGLTSITVKSPGFDTDPVNHFFRHLRNAIAHVRFEINERGDFMFWDQRNATSPPNFRAAFTQINLEQFLSYVGPALANLYFQQGVVP